MTKKLKVIEPLEPEEIKRELQSLQIQWDKIKDTRDDKKSIERQFKEVKNYLKKSGMPGLGSLFGLYATNSLMILKNDILSDTFNYDSIFLSASTSEKISVFKDHKDKFSDEEYWMNLADAYKMQNYKKIPYKTYYELFSSARPLRYKLMSDEEYEFFQQLPDELVIYRGGSVTEKKTKRYGVSWTLNFQKAKEFADVKQLRDKKPMDVFEMRIMKSDVIAFFNSRNEDEIIFIYK